MKSPSPIRCRTVRPTGPGERSIDQDQALADGWDQDTLSESRVLIAGCGALGCVVATHLARAGVGHLTLLDHDSIELSNLNRQLAFGAQDLHKPKAHILASFIQQSQGFLGTELASHAVTFEDYLFDQSPEPFDLYVACVDSQATRFEMARVALATERPFVSQGIALDGEGGYVFAQRPGEACFSCHAGPPSTQRISCGGLPIASPICGEVASRASYAALNLLMGRDFRWNLWRTFTTSGSNSSHTTPRDPNCVLCHD